MSIIDLKPRGEASTSEGPPAVKTGDPGSQDSGWQATDAAWLTSRQPLLRMIARRLCHGGAESEDLVQETNVRALAQVLKTGELPVNPDAWLARVLTNLFLDRVRSPWLHGSQSDSFDDHAAPTPEPGMQWEDFSVEDVKAVLPKLRSETRETFELHYLDGMRCSDIATRLGIAPNTVVTRLWRARKHLKELLIETRTGVEAGRE